MRYETLGYSDLRVSRVCLGSMTWGMQNTQHDADIQIEYALQQGVNFIDTAEMYAIPPTPDTYGKTESIIGNWLSRHSNRRSEIVLATKIAGVGLNWIREGAPITKQAVINAVNLSLQRLQTDYIDLYQLHWPNRTTPHFGKHVPGRVDFSHVDPEVETAGMLDILSGIAECVKAGKIRYFGLSDDSTWGINTYLRLAQSENLPRLVSIQNEFSLLHAKDWPYLIENCLHEKVAYLPWSPLAAGMLSGKYLNGQRPKGSRWTLVNEGALFRNTPQANLAVERYTELALSKGITAAQLALAWVDQVPGVTSTIIGATSLEQLKEDIAAFNVRLESDTLQQIQHILKDYPLPY